MKVSSSLGQNVESAFSLKIQRTLASSAPPRPMVTVELPDALSYLERLCCDAADVYQLCDVPGSQNLSTAYIAFMSHKPYPSVYVRALAQSFLSQSQTQVGSPALKERILSDLASLVLPAVSPLSRVDDTTQRSSEDAELLDILTAFVTKCENPYLMK